MHLSCQKVTKILVFLSIYCFLIMILLLQFHAHYEKYSNTNNSPINTHISPHAPISITGNGEFTATNGVINEGALGTKSDPYIIENWSISTSGSYGIQLQHTSAHVIIRNCTIMRNDASSGKGIYLNNVSNVILLNNTVYRFVYGIYIDESHNNTVSLCKIWNEIWGISLKNSYYCTVMHNYANGHSSTGIQSSSSTENVIRNNEVENSRAGIMIGNSYYSNITDNYCHHNEYYGIEMSWGNGNNTIYHNTLIRNFRYGIYIYTLDQDNEIYNNTLYLNGIGPIAGGGVGVDSIYNNTLRYQNEMQTSNIPWLQPHNSSATGRYCREFILSTFDTAASPYQLVFRIIYERYHNGNATISLTANIYTLTDYYLTNTKGNLMYDVIITYNGTEYIAFGYKSDTTSSYETSRELYEFPMCAQNVTESLDNIYLTVNLSCVCTSSGWNTTHSTLLTTIIIPSYSWHGGIPGFPIFQTILGLLGLLTILKIKKKITL